MTGLAVHRAKPLSAAVGENTEEHRSREARGPAAGGTGEGTAGQEPRATDCCVFTGSMPITYLRSPLLFLIRKRKLPLQEQHRLPELSIWGAAQTF